MRGEPTLGIVDTDEDLSGDYKLDATFTVGKGTAYVSTAGRLGAKSLRTSR